MLKVQKGDIFVDMNEFYKIKDKLRIYEYNLKKGEKI